MSRILREMFLRPCSLEIEGRKSAKTIRQNFAAFFTDLLQTFRKNFALGACGAGTISEMLEQNLSNKPQNTLRSIF